MDYVSGLSGFNVQALGTCLDQKSGAAAVDRDLKLGNDIGVTGTPTMFINGGRVGGYQPDQIRSLIDQATRAGAGSGVPPSH